MSEKIKITIVTESSGEETKTSSLREDKAHGEERIRAHGAEKTLIVSHDTDKTLMATLLKEGLARGSFCGGRGDCGRCRVQFIQGETLPAPLERSLLLPGELREGYRLACLARPKKDCVVRLAFPEETEIDILTDMVQEDKTETSGQEAVGSEAGRPGTGGLQGREAGSDGPGADMQSCLVAVDLGTTTIAMQMFSLESGKLIDTYCEMNPQRIYGADVLSRIQASCDGNREELRSLVREVLKRGVDKFAKTLEQSAARRNTSDGMESMRYIKCICLAGNTTMEHLLMGYDVSGLGVSPFVPVTLGLQKSEMMGIPLYLMPGISAFVGGDIAAGLYSLGLLDETAGSAQSGATLFIDLGTNGEMALILEGRMIVTATAAGPAFEGRGGVIGTDMIAVTAMLKRQGIVDDTGLMREPYFSEGVTVYRNGSARMELLTGVQAVEGLVCSLTNKDIRALQMAKAAVRAGMEVLWKKSGEPPINKVYLAGGFGYYLDVDAAFEIGLLPESLRGRVRAVGNTALAGAGQIGKRLCEGSLDEKQLESRLASAESVNLAEQEEFEGLYMKFLDLAAG